MHVRRVPSLSSSPAERGDAGASLILALIFLLVSSAVVLSLTAAATNDLNNVRKFSTARVYHADLSSAVDVALYDVRYTPATCTTSVPVPFTSADGLVTLDVWCNTPAGTVNLLSTQTRVVDLYACPTTVTSESACAAQPDLTAVATFDDYAPGLHTPLTSPCAVNCGSGMIVSDWKFRL